MRVKIRLFVKNIKAVCCLPKCLARLLLILCKLVFVNARKCEREVVFRVCIKVFAVISDILAKLFFLEFPDVQFLSRVTESLNAIGQIDPGLGKSV